MDHAEYQPSIAVPMPLSKPLAFLNKFSMPENLSSFALEVMNVNSIVNKMSFMKFTRWMLLMVMFDLLCW
jgi:hypothetical protein